MRILLALLVVASASLSACGDSRDESPSEASALAEKAPVDKDKLDQVKEDKAQEADAQVQVDAQVVLEKVSNDSVDKTAVAVAAKPKATLTPKPKATLTPKPKVAPMPELLGAIGGKGSPGGSGLFSSDNGASLDRAIAHAKLGTAASAPASTEKVVSRITFGHAKALSPSNLNSADLVKIIRGKYLGGLKRCHLQLLKLAPTSEGKASIFFTVAPSGRVAKAKSNSFAPTMDACIEGQVSKWRFSVPKDNGKATSAKFMLPLTLSIGSR